MSVDVLIKEKGLFRKKRELSDIIFENMGYGVMDEAYRLCEGEKGNCTVVYHKSNICRGFEVSLDKGSVELRMSLPTGEAEIRFFYDYIKKICNLLNTKTFERNGEMASFDKIESYIAGDISASEDALKQIDENISKGEYRTMYLFGAYHPIAIGKRELAITRHDPQKLGRMLHEMQVMDVYYARSSVYRRLDESLFGMYVLSAGVTTILPFEPGVFMNHELKVDDWNVLLVAGDERKGAVSFGDFMANIDTSEIYDTEHFVITLDEERMNELVAQYGKEL